MLDGSNAASLALMAVSAPPLARAAFSDGFSVLVGVTALLLLIRTRANPAWWMAAGGLPGCLRSAA